MKFKAGDIVQEFDNYGNPIMINDSPAIRTVVSSETYKNNVEKFDTNKYVMIETCNLHFKRFKKIETGFRPYRISDELNDKEYRIVQEILKEMQYNPNFLEDVSGVENSDEKFLSERERQIVLSTIQWMGTHVGEYFIKSTEQKNLVDK